MNIYCYFCGAQGTSYSMPLFPESDTDQYDVPADHPFSLSLDYECYRCHDEYGVIPVTCFSAFLIDMLEFDFVQVSIRNWTITVDHKEMTLSHWSTSTYLFKDYPKSPFSQVKVNKVHLSYLKKRFSVLEPFT